MVEVRVNNSVYFNGVAQTNLSSYVLETEQFFNKGYPYLLVNGLFLAGGFTANESRTGKMTLNLGPLNKGDVIEAFNSSRALSGLSSGLEMWETFRQIRGDYANRVNFPTISAVIDDPDPVIIANLGVLSSAKNLFPLGLDTGATEISNYILIEDALKRALADMLIYYNMELMKKDSDLSSFSKEGFLAYFSGKRYAGSVGVYDSALTVRLLKKDGSYCIASDKAVKNGSIQEADNLKIIIDKPQLNVSVNVLSNPNYFKPVRGYEAGCYIPNDFNTLNPRIIKKAFQQTELWNESTDFEGFIEFDERLPDLQSTTEYTKIEYYKKKRIEALKPPGNDVKELDGPQLNDNVQITFSRPDFNFEPSGNRDEQELPVIKISPNMLEDDLKNKAPYLFDVVISALNNSHATSWDMYYIKKGGSYKRVIGNAVDFEVAPDMLINGRFTANNANIIRLICRDEKGYFISDLNGSNRSERLTNINQIVYIETYEPISDTELREAYGVTDIPDVPYFIFTLSDEAFTTTKEPYTVNLNCAYEGRVKDRDGVFTFIDWKDSYEQRDYFTISTRLDKAKGNDFQILGTSKGGTADIKSITLDDAVPSDRKIKFKFNETYQIDTITADFATTLNNAKRHYLKDFTCVKGEVTIKIPPESTLMLDKTKIMFYVGYREYEQSDNSE